MNFRRFTPFLDPTVSTWAVEARLLRWLSLIWLLIGLATIFSASYPIADGQTVGLYFVKRQIVWVVIGWIGFELAARSPLRLTQKVSSWLFLGLLGLLLVILVPGLGTTINGATRWLSIGGVQLQPSELIKPFLILQGAKLFSQWKWLSWPTRLTWLGIFALVLIAILLQPNLSTAALCGMTLWLIALAAGLPYAYLGSTAIGGILLAVVSIRSNEYQLRRILSFLNPWADPLGDGYQLIQSLLAVGSGGLRGAGFGLSQQKLFYLPIQHTDFIFAVFAEEFGFVGCVMLLLLLGIYATLSLSIALKASSQVYQLIAVGCMVMLIGQALLNIGVATGTLPTTGLPFPLLSYGGNSLITSLLLAGLIIRVGRESNEAPVLPLRQTSSAPAGRFDNSELV